MKPYLLSGAVHEFTSEAVEYLEQYHFLFYEDCSRHTMQAGLFHGQKEDGALMPSATTRNSKRSDLYGEAVSLAAFQHLAAKLMWDIGCCSLKIEPDYVTR